MRFGRSYFDYFARWGNLGLLRFCYEMRCARICSGSQIKEKTEIKLQKNGSIHQKQHKVLIRSCFSGFSAKRKDSFLLTFFSEETLFTCPFSKVGLGFAMCADGGSISLFFLCASFQLFGQGTSEN